MVLLLLANREGELEVVQEAVGLLPLALASTVGGGALRLLLTALCMLKGPLAGELRSNPGGVPGDASDRSLLRLLW